VIKRVKTTDLTTGMYVILPRLWLRELFPENHFLIRGEDDIQRIESLEIRVVSIDTSKGLDLPAGDRPLEPPGEALETAKNISGRIRGLVEDRNLPPQKKARLVYGESMALMKSLFDSPTPECIRATKEGVFHVVDLILSDAAVTAQMLGILSHDYYTYTHSVNVGVLSVSLARVLYRQTSLETLHELGAGFFFHDLGKVRVPGKIINKPGRLNEAEMGEMRTHPYKGYEILDEAGFLTKEAELIVLQHHERSDGTGYPQGLKGREIHEYGRICSLADVFDALTSRRSYHRERSPFDALELMREKMLGHFERELFERFVLLFGP